MKLGPSCQNVFVCGGMCSGSAVKRRIQGTHTRDTQLESQWRSGDLLSGVEGGSELGQRLCARHAESLIPVCFNKFGDPVNIINHIILVWDIPKNSDVKSQNNTWCSSLEKEKMPELSSAEIRWFQVFEIK